MCWVNVCTIGCYVGKGHGYRGNVSTTESGRTCQRWDVDHPHTTDKNDKDPGRFPDGDIHHNYCRNPGNIHKPFCWTTDPKMEVDYCDIPSCGKISDSHTL